MLELLPKLDASKSVYQQISDYINHMKAQVKMSEIKERIVDSSIDKIGLLNGDMLKYERVTTALRQSTKLLDEITRLNLVMTAYQVPSSEMTSSHLVSWH